MTPDPNTPRPLIDLEAIRTHLTTALDDIPTLLAEVRRLAALLARARTEFANLLAATRATLAAHRDGEPDPLWYLRDQLAEHERQEEADR
jgi:hypothetical protein